MRVLVAVLTKYGFQEIVSKWTPTARTSEPVAGVAVASVYTRIRQALEELGPTFVKLGQVLSNRDDILPKELVLELQRLQDRVAEDRMDVHAVLADQFGADYMSGFESIDTEPLATASIAQVYRATLTDGRAVVLKIQRPNIRSVIEADILLMKDLAAVLTRSFDFASRISLVQAVNTFERSILIELSLLNERDNLVRFARYFSAHPHVYTPWVFETYCSDEVLCMEFIDGVKITDLPLGPSTNELVDRLLQVYLSQILEHGFFMPIRTQATSLLDPMAGWFLSTWVRWPPSMPPTASNWRT